MLIFFFICPNRIFGGENRPPKIGLVNTHLILTYYNVIFYNETTWKNFLTIRDEKCDFLKFVEKFVWKWTAQKLFFVAQKVAK